jgi:hypothetical protein
MESVTTPLGRFVKIVAVDHGDKVCLYEVFNPSGYMHKCSKDGKHSIYLGITNEKGELTEEQRQKLHNFTHRYGN